MAGQTESVIALIIAQIDSGEVLPGNAIDEKELMRLCGVSRTPVREALIQLETDGLVQRNARKGVVIFQPTVEEFLAILEVHANLESYAAGLAAHRITDETKVELLATVSACETHVETYGSTQHAQYYQLNMKFHETIVRAANNAVLMQLVKTNARKLMAYYRNRYRHPNAAQSSAKDHALIATHIIEHRSTEASAAMMEHFNYDRQTVMDLIATVG